jgi:hypothetical protein
MGFVNVNDVKPGMIVVRDVCDHTGNILLKSGNEITEKYIRIFRMWGIVSVDIKGVADNSATHKSEMTQIDNILLSEAEERGKELFCNSNLDHPAMAELYKLTIYRLAQRTEGEKE